MPRDLNRSTAFVDLRLRAGEVAGPLDLAELLLVGETHAVRGERGLQRPLDRGMACG